MQNFEPHIFMQEALKQASLASTLGEVPVGAVAVHEGNIIASAHNEVEQNRDATQHAEILVLRRASEHLQRWRLDGVSVYVTLEPCSMCIGAMVLARVNALYFGAYDPRQGAVGSLYDLSNHPELPHSIPVSGGILASSSEAMLRAFFENQRTTGRGVRAV